MIKYGDRVRVREGFFKGLEGIAVDYIYEDVTTTNNRMIDVQFKPSLNTPRFDIKCFDERNLEII